MFLRTESFDVTDAARRLVHFFSFKEDLWGRAKLTKRITLADFDKYDYETLEHGRAQLSCCSRSISDFQQLESPQIFRRRQPGMFQPVLQYTYTCLLTFRNMLSLAPNPFLVPYTLC
jgi:hypothetical protein